MVWFTSLSSTEWIFIFLFLIAYAVYVIRLYRISRALQSGATRFAVKLVLRSAYFALFLIALLGPSFGDTSREVKSIGKDIFVAVDLSQSMNATDVQPSRLEKVKYELKNIVEAFNSDRIGLIIFSSDAFVQCPLTYDQSALNLFIETLSTGLVPSTGTDFAPPLKLAMDKLLSEESTANEVKSKIIILISDGEDFGESTADVASEIEQNKLTLFTLGVGTESGSKIPTRGGFKTDASGQVVISQLNARDLKNLAYLTGGKYFEINENINDVNRMISAINDLEGELRDSKTIDVSANKYYYFLALALLLVAIDWLWSIKVLRI
jgi:Ca-activated chloride channel family protein